MSRPTSSTGRYTPRDAPMQMPNVFVVPPEEDESPAWCFFDADNPALSQVIEQPETSGTSFFHLSTDADEYPDDQDYMDTTILPRETMSVLDASITDYHRADDDIDSDTESEYERDSGPEDDLNSIRENTCNQYQDSRNVADDSDVIEVVKVSRRAHLPDRQNSEEHGVRADVKRSATLKSRASKVFRSLRGSLRSSKSRAQDTSPPPLPTRAVPNPSSPKQAEEAGRARSPTISRRASRTLTQLFTAPSLKSQSSMASFDDRPPMSPTDSSSITSPASSTHPPSRPLSRHPSLYTAASQEEARLRATSPTPTTSSSKSATRRFSFQKLFSFTTASSTATPPIPTDSGRTTPTPRSTTSTPPSDMSSVLTSGPQTPTSSDEPNSVRLVSRTDTTEAPVFGNFESMFDADVGLNLGVGLGLNITSHSNPSPNVTPRKSRSNSLRQTWESVAPRRFTKGMPTPRQELDLDEEGDVSFEMRLDSLHFDDLSFDADQFTAK